jgi:hypothetical protein
MYTRTNNRGKVYEFTEDRETLAGWSVHGGGNAHSDGFTTVAKRELNRPEGIAFGRGQSHNPDRAEAYLYLDAQDNGATAMTGKYEIVILNAANEKVATVDRGRLEEVRDGDPDNDSRGDWGKPFPYKKIRGGKGEVLGGSGHKVALRLNLDDGEGVFSVGNSSMVAEGRSGRLIN